jgi:CDP-glycerol glycerophosphotransferase (TagB/SpsB family)
MEILCETTDDEKGSTGQIIFAPHHSFEEKSLGLATFIWSGFCFLAFAEQNPNIEFIFKPHPRFRYALERNLIFSKDKIEEFYKRLDQASNILICEDGDYGEIFRKSRLLITDCGSFLAEYYVFNKPVVHLISQSSVGLTELGRGLTKNYYAARNEGEFMDLLEMLVIENCDPLLPYRKKQSDIFGLDGGEKPSKKIADFLEKTIWGDVNNLQ